MPRTPEFPQYDPAVAEAIGAGAGLLTDGLPGYLGIRHTAIGPGTLTAEVEVRSDLLNPFGTLHGGVLSALVDHVLGSVVYPLIPRGAWAATTEYKLNLTAPVRSGVLRAEATVVSMTPRSAVVVVEAHEITGEADATDHDRPPRLVGLAQGSVTIKPPADDARSVEPVNPPRT